MESAVNIGNPLSIISRKAGGDRINFVCVWTKTDIMTVQVKVIESAVICTCIILYVHTILQERI